ncbi:MAG: PilZ domain-containing protein, partial [Deltaproteobacteria bacterium]|nr:PilZ domain-containing protein [Deltaproteobacteria bacterium]
MQPRETTQLVEAYLVVDQPRQRMSYWSNALGLLDAHATPPLADVAAYYDPDADQALLAVRYDEASIGQARLAFVVELALLHEIGMIQPAELSAGDRKRFLGERLARCTLHVSNQRGVLNTLTELVKRLRELRSKKAPGVAAARGLPRGDTSDPVMLIAAKGTRDDLPSAPRGTRDGLVSPARPLTEFPRADPPRRGISPHVIVRGAHRAATVEMESAEAYRKATESMRQPDLYGEAPESIRRFEARRPEAQPRRAPKSPSRPPPLPATTLRARSSSQGATEPFTPPATVTPPGIIYARYLRSGRWVPIRIGALSLKGAALMSGALPRMHDHVDVALSFGSHRAMVRGNVGKVSSVQEAAMSGTATFSVSFELDDAARRQLTALLTAARAANVTIKPPPPRAARRYPVEWPVGIGTSRGVVRGNAYDVSRDGMFVQPSHALTLHSTVNFSSVLDDGEAPIAGRAKVVRHITEVEAKACGLAAGYGLKIIDMGEDDRARWLAFLLRIEQRSERRVLIAASPARLAELQSILSALGYAVTGGTDPNALVQLASSDARPVDAALIDAVWLTPQASPEWVQSLFAPR